MPSLSISRLISGPCFPSSSARSLVIDRAVRSLSSSGDSSRLKLELERPAGLCAFTWCLSLIPSVLLVFLHSPAPTQFSAVSLLLSLLPPAFHWFEADSIVCWSEPPPPALLVPRLCTVTRRSRPNKTQVVGWCCFGFLVTSSRQSNVLACSCHR